MTNKQINHLYNAGFDIDVVHRNKGLEINKEFIDHPLYLQCRFDRQG